MRVEVYWNLHKRCFSVRALEGVDRGRVINHADKVLLRDVSFVVQPAGRKRAIRENRKNVHAFVRGTLEGVDNVALFDESGPALTPDHLKRSAERRRRGLAVTYNPHRDETFVGIWPMEYQPGRVAHIPIHDADTVALERGAGRPVITAWNVEEF